MKILVSLMKFVMELFDKEKTHSESNSIFGMVIAIILLIIVGFSVTRLYKTSGKLVEANNQMEKLVIDVSDKQNTISQLENKIQKLEEQVLIQRELLTTFAVKTINPQATESEATEQDTEETKQ